MANIKAINSELHLNLLSNEQLDDIKSATLHVLETVGVRFPSDKALDVFEEHGAFVDRENQIVKLSKDLVLTSMSNAPREYILAGRSPGSELHLGNGSSYFGTDGCGVETVDFETGKKRLSTKDDVAKMAIISDYLTSIAFYWPMVSAQDYGRLAPLHELDASYNNLTKHVQTETVMGEQLAKYAVEMALVIAGSQENLQSQPPLSSLVCTIAPLSQDKEGLEAAMVFAEAGIPVGFMGMPTMGSTAPAVPGGALVIGNAEAVSAMVLMQLINPGTPVFQSLLVSGIDPQSAEYLISLPEKYLCNVAAVEMAHDWGVPALAGSFGLNHEEPATWQLGKDSVYTALLCALAGTDFTIGLGMLKASTLLFPEQIIFDDEIYHNHRIMAKGLNINSEDFAMDVIMDVGPGGHFLSQKHTRAHLREIWIPELTHPRPSGNGTPSLDIQQRAKDNIKRILADHKPEPLQEVERNELTKILNFAERELGN